MGKTIAQKIFEKHLVDSPFPNTYVLKLDRVFCHEITTPIAINDLVDRGMDKVFDSTKIKAVMTQFGARYSGQESFIGSEERTSHP